MKKSLSHFKDLITKGRLLQSFQILSSKKIDELNTYANENKQKTIKAVFSFSVFLFVLTIIFSFYQCYSKQEESSVSSFSNIEDISPMITAKQQIEEIKKNHIEDERSIILQGKQLKIELDSLLSLSPKTHRDSIEILRKHKQLEIIVNYLNEKN